MSLSVIDWGSGIKPEVLERLFEPFCTTKEVGKGTGLGLSQVYGFAEQSGGEISVESELGSGSVFTLSFPRAAERLVATTSSSSGSSQSRTGRVLVVEDNPAVAEFAELLLRDLGHETVRASTARQAITLLEEDSKAFDVVVSDVVMPGMSGIELAFHLREHWQEVEIIFTSGYSQILSGRIPSDFRVLQKPYSVEAVTEAISAALEPKLV